MISEERLYGRSMELNESMPALITGFIGLLGVIIGGVIQVWSQHSRDRDKEIFEVRQKVSDFVIEAMDVAGRVQTIAKFLNESQRSEDMKNMLLKELQEMTMSVQYKGIELLAWAETKINNQAVKVQRLCSEATREVRDAARNGGDLSAQKATLWKKVISQEANVLGKMVAPRIWERRLRFRRSERSRKLLYGAEQKKAGEDESR